MRRRNRRDPNATPKPARGIAETHCQICARDILLVGQHIAHHGYQRPGTGWQSASCEGARQLPWEVSCDALRAHVERVVEKRDRTHERAIGPVNMLTVEVGTQRGANGKRLPVTAQVTEETLEAVTAEHRDFAVHNRKSVGRFGGYRPMTWPELVERYRLRLAAEVTSLNDYLNHQRGRLASWQPKV